MFLPRIIRYSKLVFARPSGEKVFEWAQRTEPRTTPRTASSQTRDRVNRRHRANSSTIMASLDFTLPTSLAQISKTHIAAAIFPLIAAIPYLLLKLPSPVRPPKVHPGLAGLPGPDDELRKRLKTIYPENFYEGGAYADLPFGKLRYYVVGGEFYPKVKSMLAEWVAFSTDCVPFDPSSLS